MIPLSAASTRATHLRITSPHHTATVLNASTVKPHDASEGLSLPSLHQPQIPTADDGTDNTVEQTSPLDDMPQKVINGVLLAVSFGYAAFTILNIDAGMTRGWTQSEIAMRIPLDNWSNYENSLAAAPVYTKTLINVVIYLLGDWLSQTVFQGKNVLDFDASRTLKNGFIGLCFGPLVHEYYQFSDHILPPDSLVNRMEKIFMDQSIYLSVKASIYVAAVSLLGK